MVTLALKSDPVQVGVAFPAAILACIITGGLWGTVGGDCGYLR